MSLIRAGFRSIAWLDIKLQTAYLEICNIWLIWNSDLHLQSSQISNVSIFNVYGRLLSLSLYAFLFFFILFSFLFLVPVFIFNQNNNKKFSNETRISDFYGFQFRFFLFLFLSEKVITFLITVRIIPQRRAWILFEKSSMLEMCTFNQLQVAQTTEIINYGRVTFVGLMFAIMQKVIRHSVF